MIVFPLDCCILEEKKKNTTNVMFINITQRLIKKIKKVSSLLLLMGKFEVCFHL